MCNRPASVDANGDFDLLPEIGKDRHEPINSEPAQVSLANA